MEFQYHVYDGDNHYIESCPSESVASDLATSIGGVVVQGGGPEGRGGTKLHDYREAPTQPSSTLSPQQLADLSAQQDLVRQIAVQILAGICANPRFDPANIDAPIRVAIDLAARLVDVTSGRANLATPEDATSVPPDGTTRREYSTARPGDGPAVRVVLPRR